MILTKPRFSLLDQVLRGSSVLFIAMMLVNLLNYGYAFFLSRYLGPASYGAYAALISLMLITSLLPVTLQQVTAKYAAMQQSVVVYTLKLALFIGGALGLLLILASKPLSSVIHLPQPWLIALAACLPVYSLLGVLRGEVQGQQQFARMGANLVLEHGLKILATPLVFMFLPTAAGAVMATLATVPLALIHLRQGWSKLQMTKVPAPEIHALALPIFFSILAQVIINNSDVLLVNMFFQHEAAGIYAAIALIGRSVFYSSWAIGAAMLPMVAARKDNAQPLLYIALASVAVVGLGITGISALMPEFILKQVFGSAYISGAHLIAPHALMTTLYALSNVVVNHYIALGSRRVGYLPLIGAGLQVVLIVMFHHSSLQVIYSQMIAQGILLGLLLTGSFLNWFKKGDHHVIS